MPDRNLVIALDGQPSEFEAFMTRTKKVSFIPADSDHKIRVSFIGATGEVPFSDWNSSSRTGRKGRPLTGKVRKDLDKGDTFEYEAESIPPQTRRKRRRPLANPQLIVDGGR